MLNLSIFTHFPPKWYTESASGVLPLLYQKVLMIYEPHWRSSTSRLLASQCLNTIRQNSLSARPGKCSKTSKLTQQDLGFWNHARVNIPIQKCRIKLEWKKIKVIKFTFIPRNCNHFFRNIFITVSIYL